MSFCVLLSRGGRKPLRWETLVYGFLLSFISCLLCLDFSVYFSPPPNSTITTASEWRCDECLKRPLAYLATNPRRKSIADHSPLIACFSYIKCVEIAAVLAKCCGRVPQMLSPAIDIWWSLIRGKTLNLYTNVCEGWEEWLDTTYPYVDKMCRLLDESYARFRCFTASLSSEVLISQCSTIYLFESN